MNRFPRWMFRARAGAESDDGFAAGVGAVLCLYLHDLSVVEHIADEVMVMYLGRCVEKGTKSQIFNNPRHPYTQALLSARLNPDDRRERIKLSGELQAH